MKYGYVILKEKCFYVKIAETKEEGAQGLMHVVDLDPRFGMFFPKSSDYEPSMWMKNTLVSLDMIWINAENKVVFIHRNAEVCSDKEICPDHDVKAVYVLELLAGTVYRILLKIGDEVSMDTSEIADGTYFSKLAILDREEEIKKLGEQVKEKRVQIGKTEIRLQKECLHGYKEKIFGDVEKATLVRDQRLVLRGYRCLVCDAFVPSKVWNTKVPALPKVSNYCERCDGNVEFEGRTGGVCESNREDHYKCTVCGYKQSSWAG